MILKRRQLMISTFFMLSVVQQEVNSQQKRLQIQEPGTLPRLVRYKRNAHGAHIEKCDRHNKKMVIRGANVTLSRYLNEDDQLWCRHAKTLEIFALNSLVIDRDLTAGDEGLSVITFAKNLILVGSRMIDLHGANGETILNRATDGTETHPDGMNGVPGNPGKNGGNFFGNFDRLILTSNTSSLTIDVSGGDGGNGQDGGNGVVGKAGENGKWEDFPSPYAELDSRMERLRHLEFNILYGYRYKNYIVHGTRGTDGGNGGDGGMAGIGGYSGFANITYPGERNVITVIRENGDRGVNGKGGRGGIGGKHGDGYQCTWRGVFADSIRWWDKCHYVPVSRVARELFATSGLPGRDGASFVGFKYPIRPNYDEFKNVEENFQRFATGNTSL